MKQITKTSPRAKGRITGAFYLAIFVAGLIYMVLIPSTGLLNNNDGAAINYIVSHQTAFWAGYSFLLLVVVFRIIVMLLFYELFKPVNKSISLLAVYFNIVASTVQAVTGIFLLMPLILLGGEHYLTAFTPPIAANLLPYNAIIAGIVGEGAMILWLLVMGVNSQRWNEQASKASERDQSVLESAAV